MLLNSGTLLEGIKIILLEQFVVSFAGVGSDAVDKECNKNCGQSCKQLLSVS